MRTIDKIAKCFEQDAGHALMQLDGKQVLTHLEIC